MSFIIGATNDVMDLLCCVVGWWKEEYFDCCYFNKYKTTQKHRGPFAKTKLCIAVFVYTWIDWNM